MKSEAGHTYHASHLVSLFTREWTEISGEKETLFQMTVSLFTREWIEMDSLEDVSERSESPSLRGSGLKSTWKRDVYCNRNVSLFTREWIEILPTLYHVPR